MTQQQTTTQKTVTAFWLSFIGGLLMLASGRLMFARFSRMPAGWRHHHMVWGPGMMGHFGWGWPWFGAIAGAIVVISAIALYVNPQHRRSLGITIAIISLFNFFLGMGGPLATILGVFGGVVALTPKQPSPE